MIQRIIEYVNFYYPNYANDGDECFIKCCLIYRYLYEKYYGKNIDFEYIKYQNYDIKIKTKSTILKNHLIFSYAFIRYCKRYGKGPGCLYLFSSPVSSHVLGFLTGIVYWYFKKGVC